MSDRMLPEAGVYADRFGNPRVWDGQQWAPYPVEAKSAEDRELVRRAHWGPYINIGRGGAWAIRSKAPLGDNYVRRQATEALNFQLTILICGFAAMAIFMIFSVVF